MHQFLYFWSNPAGVGEVQTIRNDGIHLRACQFFKLRRTSFGDTHILNAGVTFPDEVEGPIRRNFVVRICGGQIVGPRHGLHTLLREASQCLSCGQIERHGEHVVNNDTVEFTEKLGKLNLQLFQDTKVRLTRAAVVGLLLGGSTDASRESSSGTTTVGTSLEK